MSLLSKVSQTSVAATVESNGRVVRAAGRTKPRTSVNEADIKVPAKLTRLLNAIIETLLSLERRAAMNRITFPATEFVDDGTTKYRLQHDLGVIPDILVVRWDGAFAPNLRVHEDSTASTLVLVSLSAGVGTLRLEAP